MKVEDGKIIEISEIELYELYLKREMDEIMDFNEYKNSFEHLGTIITSEK